MAAERVLGDGGHVTQVAESATRAVAGTALADRRASAEYRAHLAGVLTGRAVRDVTGGARPVVRS